MKLNSHLNIRCNTLLHQILAFSFSCAILFGCQTIKTEPEAPAATLVTSTFEKPALSIISIPISADLREIEASINKAYKDTLFFDNDFEDNNRDNIKLAIIKEADIKLSAVDSRIIVSAPVKIWIKGRFKENVLGVKGITDGIPVEKQQEATFRITIKSLSDLKLNSDWTLSSQTIGNFQWREAPFLSIAGLKIPIGSLVEKTINAQIKEFARNLDKQIASNLALKAQAENYWKELQNPILVNETYNSFLRIQPKAIAATPLLAKGKNLGIRIGFYAHLFLTLNRPLQPEMYSPLPFLQLTNELPDSVFLVLTSNMTYEELSQISKKQMVGQVFKSDDNNSQITVTDIYLYGAGKNVVVKLGFDGFGKQGLVKKRIKGYAYLQGVPVYQPETQQIVLTNFDFTMKSTDMLLKSASWLLKSNLKKQMLPYLSYSVKESIAESVAEANLMLNKNWTNNIATKGSIGLVDPGQIAIDKNGINMAIRIGANLAVKVK